MGIATTKTMIQATVLTSALLSRPEARRRQLLRSRLAASEMPALAVRDPTGRPVPG